MKCGKLPSTATKAELVEAHHTKMTIKASQRAVQQPTGFGLPTRENKRNREVLDAE